MGSDTLRTRRRLVCNVVCIAGLLFFLVHTYLLLQQLLNIDDEFSSSFEFMKILYNAKYKNTSILISRKPRNTFGYLGKPVILNLLSASDKLRIRNGWIKHRFNQFVSDLIPVQRPLPDFRLSACVRKTYPKNLPSASVVIPFHNEALSTLLRTVHSVMNNSPPHLLREIVLVDDLSESEDIKINLESALSRLPVVKLIKTSEWKGLVSARLYGYDVTTSNVTIFLDSHCEVTTGWLEPLLARINENDNVVLTSVVDVISDDTFEYLPQPLHGFVPVGTFDWNLNFVWKRNFKFRNTTHPIKSATLLGCVIAVSRRFFDRIGRFDSGLSIWGGENLEISFKAWMCGGRVEVIPCSRIGHVFRAFLPYISGRTGQMIIKRNLLRVADVWMDDYKVYHHQSINNKLTEIGDTSQMKQLRLELKCSSFEYYLQRLLPMMFIPGFCNMSGLIQNKFVSLCITADSSKMDIMQVNAIVNECIDEDQNQLWFVCERGEIRSHNGCWANYGGSDVILKQCSFGESSSQIWQYKQNNSIIHLRTGKCVHLNKSNQLVLSPCQRSSRQKWTLLTRPMAGPRPPWRSRSYG